MTVLKNNLPPIVEQIVLPEGQLDLQEILAQFKQPVPTNFVELKEVSYLCSTSPKWNKPLSERYTFQQGENWLFLDIPHPLIERLRLEKGADIPYPVYISPSVLDKDLSFGAYTIADETEIFFEQPLTINNLALNLTRWLVEIESLKTQIQALKEEKAINQQTITDLQTQRDNSLNNITQLETLLAGERTSSQTEITNLKEWKNQIKFNLVPLFWPQTFYTEDTPAASVLVAKIKELVQEKNNFLCRPTPAEQELVRASFDQLISQILILEQKLTLAQTELKTIPVNWKTRLTTARQRIVDLEREKEELNNDWQDRLQQQLTQKDNEIDRLRNKIKEIERERDDRPTQQQLNNIQQELNKEKGWWDKWISSRDRFMPFNDIGEVVIDSRGFGFLTISIGGGNHQNSKEKVLEIIKKELKILHNDIMKK
jgi:predicted  nucleic acid-binding Zn-ribbon protein